MGGFLLPKKKKRSWREIYLGEKRGQVWTDGSQQEGLHLEILEMRKISVSRRMNLTSTLSPRLVTRVQEVSSFEIAWRWSSIAGAAILKSEI